MGLLDSVIGGLLGGNSNTNSGIGGALTSLLGGGGAGGGGMLGGLMGGNTAAGAGPTTGGLGGLLSQFEQAGLGHVAQSWVGNGANEPVSPNQLQNVFRQQQVNTMASQAGMQPNDFLSQLSQHLPKAVDGMTPGGQLPDQGSVSV